MKWFFGLTLSIGALIAAQPEAAQCKTAVTTYHYDSLRTGWNSEETLLTATNFPSNFGPLQVVALDALVDAQPLLVPSLTIADGTHDVVYVATQNNTVYAIDAETGAILLSRNLGSPVPAPTNCPAVPQVGITSTPVIDVVSQQLFVMAYVNVNGTTPTYQLHSLNLTTLADNPNSPVTVAASHTLTDGSVYTFNAVVQNQRPALLAFNGVVYAGFGSYCDFNGSVTRGWLLGWSASTLAPLVNRLTDTQATSPTNFFLSSIWMSGYGIAGGYDTGSGGGGRLMFATGNSDCNLYAMPITCPSTTTSDGVTNIQESVVKTDLTAANILGIFTPSIVLSMDWQDLDMGSGGVLMLPT